MSTSNLFPVSGCRYLGTSGATYNTLVVSPRTQSDNRARCAEVGVLAPRQRELCARSRHILDIVSSGAFAGIDECQYQFRLRRWNCSTFNTTNVFGKILKLSKSFVASLVIHS